MRNLGISGNCLCIMVNLVKPFEKRFQPEGSEDPGGGGGRTRLKQLCGNPFQKLCHLAMQRMKFHLSLSERYCLNTLYFGSETKIRLPVGLLIKFTRMIELSAPAGYGVK